MRFPFMTKITAFRVFLTVLLLALICSGCSIIVVETGPLATPRNLRATVSSNTVVLLRWTAVTDAEHYAIYRSRDGKVYYCVAFIVSAISWADTNLDPGTEYFYQIQALPSIDSERDESFKSEAVYVVTSRDEKNTLAIPQDVTALTSVDDSRMIRLSWAEVPGADSYRIERSLSESEAYSVITVTLTASLSYEDFPLGLGDEYYYRVTALYGDNFSLASVPVSARTFRTGHYSKDTARSLVPGIADAFAFSKDTMPVWVALSGVGPGTVTVAWNFESWSSIYYTLYRSESDGSLTRVSSGPITGGTPLSFAAGTGGSTGSLYLRMDWAGGRYSGLPVFSVSADW
jgi:hypothetical protein